MSEEEKEYDPPLDPYIASTIYTLRAAGIETFESCDRTYVLDARTKMPKLLTYKRNQFYT